MGTITRLWVLIWKDLLRRKNRFIATSLEVFIPIAVIIAVNFSLPNSALGDSVPSISFGSFNATQCIQKYSTFGKIIYEPSTPFTDLLMSRAGCYAGYKKSNVEPGNLHKNNSLFSIGVKFENVSADGYPKTLNYTLFPTNSAWDRMNYRWRVYGFAMPRYSTPITYTVAELQRAIDVSYLYLRNISSEQVVFEDFRGVEMDPSHFLVVVHLCFFLAITIMVPSIVGRTVEEKFTGAKELMLTMGVIRWQLWVAKFIEVGFFFLATVSGMILFLYVPLRPESNYLVISPWIFWSVLAYGLIGIILFLFFISCLFDTPSIAVYLTEIFWCLSFVFKSFLSSIIEVPAFISYLLCLLPHVSFMEGVSILLKFDNYGKDVKLLEYLSGKDDSLCLLHVLAFMTINISLYLALIWYLEQIMPGKYGQPRPYNFCLKERVTGIGELPVNSHPSSSILDLVHYGAQRYYWFPKKCLPSYCRPQEQLTEDFELIETDREPGVSIRGVKKLYKSSDSSFIHALDNVHLDFYHGEISGVLGHNGAGKTTLFSIITGMTPPSEGKVYIKGCDMSINTAEARRNIGLCPQQNMLLEDLTVLETLKFFGVVKGMNSSKIKEEALRLLRDLKLTQVKHTRAAKLSGGQKRKLSLAVAIFGGSEVLILDEPTSGMDTEIRREIWNLLLELRKERTIVLTTHFLEEADFLCDRIAILDHGKVKCHGTPDFLKARYGKGMIIKAVGNKEIKDRNEGPELLGLLKDAMNLNFGNSKVKTYQKGRTMIFELPERCEGLTRLPNILEILEICRQKPLIESYSASLLTLEDAFLRMRDDGDEISLDVLDSTATGEPKKKSSIFSGCISLANQFWALIWKKWIFFRKYYKMFVIFTCLPVWVIMMKAATEVNKNPQGLDSLNRARLAYSLDLYPSSLVMYSGLDQPDRAKLFGDLVGASSGTVEETEDIEMAAEKIFKDDLNAFLRRLSFGVLFKQQALQIFQNDYGVHVVPVALNFIHNFLLKSSYKGDAIVTYVDNRFAYKELSLHAGMQSVEKCRILDLLDFSGIQAMFYLMSPLKEGFHGAKDIQLMVTSSSLYWLSHLLFDALTFSTYITALYFLLGFSQNDTFMIENAGAILGCLFLWGSGLILLNYVISTLRKDTAGAFSVSVISYIIFAFMVHNLVGLRILPKFLRYLHPNSILIVGFENLCAGRGILPIGNLLLYNFILLCYLISKDSGVPNKIFHSLVNKMVKVNYSCEGGKDAGVAEEEEEVKTLIGKHETTANTALVVSKLRRWYFKRCQPSSVVRGLSFSVKKGECFGLLGVNGAGKTSTFRMLAGCLPPSGGRVYASSEQLSLFGRKRYLNSIGYCPQSGGLIPVFTGRELLTLFARLRGLRGPRARREVESLLEKLGLMEYAKEKCGTYSGGNKRKLSIAIAVIGGCPLVFLDEPTSGVDPVSRRRIWTVIEGVKKEGRSVVLTSHSLDECESLCSRLAIMVNGRFCCIGETTTLKNRFALGYCFQLKLTSRADSGCVEGLKKKVLAEFGVIRCRLTDEHLRMLQYHVSEEARIEWREVFTRLERLRAGCDFLESYTISTTTLEHVFLQVTRDPRESGNRIE